MKDVVLFISSAVKWEDCDSLEKWLLDIYFEKLTKALKYYQPNIDTNEVEAEYRSLFCIAWADFQRFIKGWKPNHFKINPYTEELTNKVLNQLKSKDNTN